MKEETFLWIMVGACLLLDGINGIQMEDRITALEKQIIPIVASTTSTQGEK